MPDTWPYGPPRFTTWVDCFSALRDLGMTRGDANIGAAIAGAESAYDLAVVNDTPSTGDYSVGAWQVNYYGSLYAGRVAEFGRPGHLARADVTVQARAAHTIWEQQGFDAWSTYTHGTYKAYLANNVPAGGPAGIASRDVQTAIAPPTEDYSRSVRDAAGTVRGLAGGYHDAAIVLRKMRG